jgi:hypothetical protein
MTIASADGQFILSYVQQGKNVLPQVNMPVEVRRRQIPAEIYTDGVVQEVGAQVEMVTPHFLRLGDSNMVEFGLPVKIKIPHGAQLKPGEMVDLRFGRTAARAPVPSASTVGQPADSSNLTAVRGPAR